MTQQTVGWKAHSNGSTVVISDLTDFDLDKIFDCGQCFRFEKAEDGRWCGPAFGRVLTASQEGSTLTLSKCSTEEFEYIWRAFFDLDRDYGEIRKMICTDDTISGAVRKGEGIRILRQDTWEALISFIISQNNNIPRIKKIISAVCRAYGHDIGGYFSFPTPEELSAATTEELHALGTGYRDEYIVQTVRKVLDGAFDMDKLNSLPTAEAREYLLSLKGVGGKVADCVLLFGMGRMSVCPHDVWVKRIFSEQYGLEKVNEKKGYALASGKWGDNAGIAQQYLFYAFRGF